MNLLECTDEASSDVFFANFNQDCTSLSVGSKEEFRLYSLSKVDDLEVVHGIVASDIRIIERLYSFSLVALVTVSAPTSLKLCHIAKGSEICESKNYYSNILAVKLNKSRLVVCLEKILFIHSIRNMNMEHTIRDTAPNPLGLCILSPSNDKNFLAYPDCSSRGDVCIFDAFNKCEVGVIAAHENPLAAMAFNANGTKIATASVKGTVIRVFDVIEKTKLYEFRRGVARCAQIYCLSFSQDSNYLTASSNTETVHIFRLDNMLEEASAEEPQGLVSYLTNVMSSPTSMLYQDRAFATVRLPFSGIRNICALAMIQESLRVLIVSGQNILYIYNVDSVNGGECVLEHTYDLSKKCTRGDSYEPQNDPFTFFCVLGRTEHQEAPADGNLVEVM